MDIHNADRCGLATPTLDIAAQGDPVPQLWRCPVPLSSMPRLVRDFVAEHCEPLGIDPAIGVAAVFGGVSVAAGNGIEVQSWVSNACPLGANTASVTVAPTGFGKSAGEVVLSMLRSVGSSVLSPDSQEIGTAKLRLAVCKRYLSAYLSKPPTPGSAEEIEAAENVSRLGQRVRDLEQFVESPPCIFTSDTSVPALYAMASANGGAVALASTDAGYIAKLAAENRALQMLIVNGYSGGHAPRTRVNNGVNYDGPLAVSVFWSLQPRFASHLVGQEQIDIGLRDRLLVAQPTCQRTAPAQSSADAKTRSRERLEWVLRMLVQQRASAARRGLTEEAFSPRVVPASQEAIELITALDRRLAQYQRDEPIDCALRMAENAWRLALQIAVVRHLDNNPTLDNVCIKGEDTAAAIRLADWYLGSIRALSNTTMRNAMLQDSKRLVKILRAAPNQQLWIEDLQTEYGVSRETSKKLAHLIPETFELIQAHAKGRSTGRKRKWLRLRT